MVVPNANPDIIYEEFKRAAISNSHTEITRFVDQGCAVDHVFPSGIIVFSTNCSEIIFSNNYRISVLIMVISFTDPSPLFAG